MAATFVQCAACQAELPAEARFCHSCGARVERADPDVPADPLRDALENAIRTFDMNINDARKLVLASTSTRGDLTPHTLFDAPAGVQDDLTDYR